MDYIKGLPLAPHRCRSAPHQLPLATAVCTEDNNVSEDQVRADMQEAMDCGRNCPDPIAQKLWEGFHYAGSEPTLEEFILWVASLSQQA